MLTTKLPRLTVLGAGPGDPELLTLKGARVLAEADVILYDALANHALLQHARPEAVTVPVGKRRGMRSHSQDEINALIVKYAHRYGHVVRLKGGDPFVFGRGREEMLYAEAHGLATDYVPGISSAVAAAGNVGIPVTHRGLSEGFRVITATTATGELSGSVAEAAQSRATTVLLMGLGELENIVAVFRQHGQADTPAAIVQNGTLPHAQLVTGPVAALPALAAAAGIGAPAIIIIGEVARLATAGCLAATLPPAAFAVATPASYAKVA
ncbi:uroporphyrin-III C-methyltransferase [Hymenobacter luteus]|uniref:uroporphyrinogen-III C-methyltransferase n=2 Tax=Hymenobacter TaxID=89966 RepID=A0A7W9SZW9_9BACT|nr:MULTISPECIES: uroporphyrinogen-III C-methyltransferase [Hymenobacter]MBB4601353.1 uroporphyrin-III C-methyltransferase [Hymenobacter latericoloratus]MBB6058440.1 uroporphyrin-III C-methyltransferase [Hymenobacter luteus]